MLIANKIDLEDQRVISSENGAKMAAKHSMEYFETSALTGEGIENLFQVICRNYMKVHPEEEKIQDTTTSTKEQTRESFRLI